MQRLTIRFLPIAFALAALACASPLLAPTPVPDSPATESLSPTPEAAISITDTPAPEAAPTETNALIIPATGLIAYTRFGIEGAQIFVFDWETAKSTQLTSGGFSASYPLWSPDGKLLVYSQIDTAIERIDLMVLDIFGGQEPHLLTPNGIEGFPRLSWSPDNSYIVYYGPGEGGIESDIYRIDVNTSDMLNLTSGISAWDSNPDWSSDGAHIAFVSDREPVTDDIWVMNPDGSEPRRLTGATEAEADWEDHQPVWSPDSTQIAFYRWSFLEGAGIGGGIDLEGDPGLWLVGLDGQPARQLFGFTDLPQFSEAPVWSPDGQWIALNIGNESETDVWVVSSLTGEGVNISGLPGQEMAITWSPDSQSLLFTNIDPNGNLFLYGIDRDGTGLHLLIEEPGLGSADWSSP